MQITESGRKLIANIPLDKGWLPDLIPFRMPEGGLLATSNVIPTIDGYRPDVSWPQYGSGHTSTNKPLRAATFINSDGLAYTIIGTATKLYILRPDKTVIDASQLGYTYAATDWHFEQYGDWIVAVNGTDPVQVIKNFAGSSAAAIDAPGDPGSAKYILQYQGHLILFVPKSATELTTNGTFTGSATGWTLENVAYGTNNLTITNQTTAITFYQTVALTSATTYMVTVTISGVSGGSAQFGPYFTAGSPGVLAPPQVLANGTFTFYLPSPSTASLTFGLNFLADSSAFSCTIDNVSLKTVNKRGSKWSAYENIESWTQSLATGADSQGFPEMQGQIVASGRLPNGFAVFSDGGSIVNGYYVGGAFTFNFGWQLPDRGILANSVISTNKGIFGWSKADIFLYDGNSSVSIAHGIRRTIFGSDATYGLSRTYATNIHGWYDAENQLVYWAYPISATVLNLICYSIERRLWVFVGAFTAAAFFPLYDDGIVTNIPQLAYAYLDTNYKIKSRIDGTIDTSTAFITAGEFSMPEMGIYQVQRVRPRVSGNTAALTVTVSSRMNENETPNDATAATLAASGSSGWADRLVSGRYFRIKTTLGGGEIGDMGLEFVKVGDR